MDMEQYEDDYLLKCDKTVQCEDEYRSLKGNCCLHLPTYIIVEADS